MLPLSGIITMGMIATELGVNHSITLNDTNVRTLAGKPSGGISLFDFYGKSNNAQPLINITFDSPTYIYLDSTPVYFGGRNPRLEAPMYILSQSVASNAVLPISSYAWSLSELGPTGSAGYSIFGSSENETQKYTSFIPIAVSGRLYLQYDYTVTDANGSTGSNSSTVLINWAQSVTDPDV